MAGEAKEKLKVKLVSVINPENRVVFVVAPVVTESQAVQYQAVQTIHAPGNMQVFSGSSSRVFTIQPIKLISRNSTEASQNLASLNLLRSWTKPYFGATKALATTLGAKDLGSAPDILLFSAYGESQFLGNLVKIPVVLTNIGITYPDDCDYIPCGPGPYFNTPFPTVMQIDVTLMETHSPNEYSNKFDLYQYRNGILPNF